MENYLRRWNKISYNDFKNFTYSKLFQPKFIKDLGYSIDTGKEFRDFPQISIEEYQSQLISCLIQSNISEGAKILCIGAIPEYLSNKLSADYKLYVMPNTESLFGDVSSQCVLAIGTNPYIPTSLANTFECIFTLSGLDHINFQDAKQKSAKFALTLKNMLTGSGHCYFSFESYTHKDTEALPPLAYFLFRHADIGLRSLTEFISLEEIFSDKQTGRFIRLAEEMSFMQNNTEVFQPFSYNIFLQNEPSRLETNCVSRPIDFLEKRPAYIFHHLIKCGGSSLVKNFVDWFHMEYDHILSGNDINTLSKYRFNTNLLSSDVCITSHFHYNGFYVSQRYPEILEPDSKIRLFTFVRDPLRFQTSLYYYARQKGDIDKISLSKFLMLMPNYMATLFPCTEEDYKSVIDRYFFIGILEYVQESVDILSKLCGMKSFKVKKQNISLKDEQRDLLDQRQIEEFRKLNKLDYLIYDYCVEKFNLAIRE